MFANRCALLLAFLLLGPAAGWTEEPPNFTAIAAGSDSHGTVLFAADAASGCIYLWQQADGVHGGRLEITGDLLQRYGNGCAGPPSSPTALAYRNGLLYVADAGRRELSVVGVWGGGTRILWHGAPLRRPADIAISPEGVIVIAEEELGALIWLRDGETPVVQASDLWQAPARLAFAGGALHVLDRATGALFAVQYRLTSGGSLQFDPPGKLEMKAEESLSLSPVLAAQRGILYLFAGDRLHTYIPEPGTIVSAYPEPVAGLGASRLAATAESLFQVSADGHHLWQLERPVPVDIRFELSPAGTNTALAFFYQYLAERSLLPLRPAVQSGTPLRLDRLLVAERTLVGGPADGPLVAPSPSTTAKGTPFDPGAALGNVICRENAGLCRGTAGEDVLALIPDRKIMLPAVPIRSVVRRTRLDLSGRSIVEALEELITSPELRSRFSDLEQIMAVNSDRGEPGKVTAEERAQAFAALRTGSVVLPAEAWEITIPVFAADLLDPRSTLRRFGWERKTLFLLSKETAEVHSRSIQPLDPPIAQAITDCAALTANRVAIATATRFKEIAARIQGETPVIGIMEKSNEVDMGHLAFFGTPADRVWQRPNALAWVPETVEHPFSGPSQPVLLTDDPAETLELQDPIRWHGSHVAAIIAARDSCGSSLLPKAKLFLIHADSVDDIGDGILDASTSGIRVINVSQGAPADADGNLIAWEDIRTVINNRTSVLFVIAAGNGSKNLNHRGALPPVSWGAELDHVVVVTGTDTNDNVIGEHQFGDLAMSGVDTGSKYVDLAAVGADVYSATAENRYARASGSSQAVPQVAAAAAVLFKEKPSDSPCGSAAATRARLIATADWRQQFEDKVWGGRLNFEKALFAPTDNVLITPDKARHSVDFQNDLVVTTSATAQLYRRSGTESVQGRYQIPFSRILSVQPMFSHPGRFRVVFVDQPDMRVRILLDTDLKPANNKDKLKCTARRWDSQSSTWEEEDLCGSAGIDVSRITEYYKRCRDYDFKSFD